MNRSEFLMTGWFFVASQNYQNNWFETNFQYEAGLSIARKIKSLIPGNFEVGLSDTGYLCIRAVDCELYSPSSASEAPEHLLKGSPSKTETL